MNSLYEQFGCKDKEELYNKIKNEDKMVQPLTDFIEFSKADIKNKNKAISEPETLIKYLKTTKMPTIDSGTIVFVNTKNQPVDLRRSRLSRKNDIKDTLKEGLLAGGTRVFLAFNEKTPNYRIDWAKSLFEEIGMKVVDQLTYYEENNKLYSNTGDRDYRLTSSYELINDEMDNYKNKDFSSTLDYTNFSSYYAGKEIENLNIINDIEKIKENLKVGYQHHDQEVFGIISYDSNDKVIGVSEMFRGGVDSSIVDFKIIAKNLLLTPDLKGYSIYHNHPSGNPIPSNEDIHLTSKMSSMSETLGIELMEHFIIGKENVLLFSKDVDSFKSQNNNYQEKIKNKVAEKSGKYRNNKMNIDIKPGDVIKTSLSDETIVLAVKGEDALLFNGNQFVEAHGIGQNEEKIFWNYGHYHNELPTNIFEKENKSVEEIKGVLNSLIQNSYENYIKAIISIEKDITDDSTLTEMYNKYMESDINLLNDYFDEIEYDMEHDNRIGERDEDKSKYEIDNLLRTQDLEEGSSKEYKRLILDNKFSDINLKKGKIKDKFEKESKKRKSVKKGSLLEELKSNSKKDKSNNINKKQYTVIKNLPL
ncbi:JAB domain-containing protein [Senegalia sp. (in: firmicutes)]|uniref:JAB domain-containing protein n=1 Tax=Senegalia sp. (in: firmicutes) TaxID=1924098 RepID=UPI003F995822